MMDVLILIVAVPALCFGLYLIYDFLAWRFQSRITLARITGFQDRSYLKVPLPNVEFETDSGEKRQASVQQIDRLLYLLNRPGEGSFIVVSYSETDPQRVRVSGYLKPLAGSILALPVIAGGGMALGKTVLATKAAYLLIFIAILLGGWVGLKLIQRSD